MSVASIAIGLARAALKAVHAGRWRVLGASELAGATFTAIAESEPPNVLETELATDSRERTFLYVDRPAIALQRGMYVEGQGFEWQVVGDLDDNPLRAWVKYEIQKKAEFDT